MSISDKKNENTIIEHLDELRSVIIKSLVIIAILFPVCAIMLMLGFGLIFQLPIFVNILTYTGLIEIRTMKKSRPIIIVSIFVLSAILTPPDIISQLAMVLPSIILFEISLQFASMAKRKKRKINGENNESTV